MKQKTNTNYSAKSKRKMPNLSGHGAFEDDILNAGLGDDKIKGGTKNEHLYGDLALTAADFRSNGTLLNKTNRQHGNDQLKGNGGDDWLQDQLGRDLMFGGDGDDVLVSVSDSNIPRENPKIAANVDDGNDVDKLVFRKKFYNPKGLQANDRMTGGAGSDTFKFELLINAPEDIYKKHTRKNGSINWGMNGVAGENNNYHDHWVEGIGRDVITDFSGAGGEGDQILITGHTVEYKVIKESNKQVTLGVYSDQGADGVRGGGAHDLDVLGVIQVNHDGNFNLNKDVTVVKNDLGSFQDKHRSQPNILGGGFGSNKIRGGAQDEVLYGDVALTANNFKPNGDISRKTRKQFGNDRIVGKGGNDWLQDQLGRDRMFGGDGNDVLVSLSDSNTPRENTKIGANVDDGNDVDKLIFGKRFYNPDGLQANDRLTGGGGADTFKFGLLINAPEDIYKKHIKRDGLINWGMNGVAGENDNYHDHWVEGIGRDTITDFSGTGGEGDKIVITGHTVEYKVIKESTSQITLGIYSDQGGDGVRGGGAHDLDVLGVIKVNHDGNFNLNKDISVVKADLGSF
ncbi:calcium-binding protein [Leptothoe spongobia]|uniref:Calcium-binding protein n=1 Tax=Leptothoe spongobia TAU-MAC 1115 TaxID=1967444 RepID=A0A947GSB6_9CYAN|nr:calcium-binding protein [Leptothoe spongobia]MBT9317876.1 calcium-binding protein [Leptothoe spongobia TAU-MAC 1115]